MIESSTHSQTFPVMNFSSPTCTVSGLVALINERDEATSSTVRCKKTFPTGSRVVRHGSLSPKIFAKVGPVHELLKFTNVREPSRTFAKMM